MTTAHCVIFKTRLAHLLLGQGCSIGDHWEQQPPEGHSHWLQAGPQSGLDCLQLSTGGTLTDWKLALILVFTVTNWLNCHKHLHILFYNDHLLPIRSHDILLLIYTGTSLIDGLVKRQYLTLISNLSCLFKKNFL